MDALYAKVKDLEKAYPEGSVYVDGAGLTSTSWILFYPINCFCSVAAATRAFKIIIYKIYA